MDEVNSLEWQQIKIFDNLDIKDKICLDLGCGDGRISRLLVKMEHLKLLELTN